MTTTTAAATKTTSDDQPSIANDRTWQDAVCTLVDHFVRTEACFSSGELAKLLREQRVDFRFAVAELGEFVKDLFHEGAIEYRDDYGRVSPAVQVPRRTTGRSRTPAGTEVFVYAPTPALGASHDFEVEIPRPGFTPTALERQRFAAAVAQANAPMVASVHGDGRLCIPRRAFEDLSHATGVSIKGGDTVYVEVDDSGDALRVYLESRAGCSAHALSPERGRVRFSAPANLKAFAAGASYAIVVDGDALRIALG
ncbi:hypothetical protein G6O69_07605 [Pseudenhygromyxa sp. WMMC2535]|uniref:hypothetical protein n=1 Tax=Pseudenhygromyxa sp. WMMC2535 TaxID=2712867 RepID=UPI00155665C3|nr:hypothetical protein [Pseudenhygromyxa sp. WMMC2535]NVB37694.1 hypothetical protein [Pseudenhygromyxa sp. WMMC2535]